MVEAIASDEFIPRIERCFKKGDLMGAYRDEKRGTWYVSLRYKDWRGESEKKMRRGFPTRRWRGRSRSRAVWQAWRR